MQKSHCTFDLCTLRASQRLLLLLQYADFILCVIFVRASRCRRGGPPGVGRRAIPRQPRRLCSPSRPHHTSWARYLADDLLRVYSSEVSACRCGFNDVACEMLFDSSPSNVAHFQTQGVLCYRVTAAALLLFAIVDIVKPAAESAASLTRPHVLSYPSNCFFSSVSGCVQLRQFL